jgi:ferredoxin-NADP reductase
MAATERAPHEALIERVAVRELRVGEVVREAPAATSLWLENDEERPVSFQPGEFLTLRFVVDGRPLYRDYSLSSDPGDARRLRVTVKLVEGGRVSRHVAEEVRTGDRVRTIGPSGQFVYYPDPAAERRLVFVAAGSGVAPLVAMIHAALREEPRTRVDLVCLGRREEDILFRAELAALAAAHPRFRVTHVLTQPPAGWTGPRGRLQGATLAATVPLLPGALYHVCGPQGMMDAVTAYLMAGGMLSTDIRVESFTSPADPREPADPARRHTLHFARSGVRVALDEHTTLFEAGVAAGVRLHSECRLGDCGVCQVTIRAGRVTTVADSVLTRAGVHDPARVLACRSWARSDVVVDA